MNIKGKEEISGPRHCFAEAEVDTCISKERQPGSGMKYFVRGTWWSAKKHGTSLAARVLSLEICTNY